MRRCGQSLRPPSMRNPAVLLLSAVACTSAEPHGVEAPAPVVAPIEVPATNQIAATPDRKVRAPDYALRCTDAGSEYGVRVNALGAAITWHLPGSPRHTVLHELEAGERERLDELALAVHRSEIAPLGTGTPTTQRCRLSVSVDGLTLAEDIDGTPPRGATLDLVRALVAFGEPLRRTPAFEPALASCRATIRALDQAAQPREVVHFDGRTQLSFGGAADGATDETCTVEVTATQGSAP